MQDRGNVSTKLPILHVVPITSSELVHRKRFRTPVYTTSARGDVSGRGLVFKGSDHSPPLVDLWK